MVLIIQAMEVAETVTMEAMATAMETAPETIDHKESLMLRRSLFFLLFTAAATTFLGCQTTQPKTREAKADTALLQKKTAPSPTKVNETLNQPQPGYNQEPGEPPISS